MVCLFPHTLGSCCDDDEEKEEEEQRYGMPGLTPASEQSFDFDDHAYAAAPGSHGGSVDGENAFVPPRCVFFVVLFFLGQNTRARALHLFVLAAESTRRRGSRAGDEDDEEEVVRADFARDACRKAPNAIGVSILFFFYIFAFLSSVFLCVCARRATRDVEKIRRR